MLAHLFAAEKRLFSSWLAAHGWTQLVEVPVYLYVFLSDSATGRPGDGGVASAALTAVWSSLITHPAATATYWSWDWWFVPPPARDNPIGTAGAFSSYITGAPVVLLLNLLER